MSYASSAGHSAKGEWMRNHLGNDLTSYHGHITDTDRWGHYRARQGDVFVCTPPKSGTTWTIAIVSMLIHGRTDVTPSRLVEWVDSNLEPVETVVGRMQTQSYRRCIKTHTPFDGLPYSEEARYIAVYRHPIDVLFSLRKHVRNSVRTEPDHPLIGDIDTMIDTYMSPATKDGSWDEDKLERLASHYLSFVRPARPDNLLLLHYADMRRDHRGAVNAIARHLNLAASDGLNDAVTDATRFDAMKAEADRHAPIAALGFWKENSAFFDSAGEHKWRGRVSNEQLERYRRHIGDLMSAPEAHWLENGSITV